MSARRVALLAAFVLVLSLWPAGAVTAEASADEVVCPPGEVEESGFADIGGNTHEASIACAAWRGLAQGRSTHTYAPSLAVNRGQMASFLARLIDLVDGGLLPEPSDQGFDDVAGNTHADRINQLAAVEIVRGTTAETYAPQSPVSRAQMATFLVRTYEFIAGTELPLGPDRFSDTASDFHRENINKAAEAGFTTGVTATTYQPRARVRRDQMASFLIRVAERLAADGLLGPIDDDMGGSEVLLEIGWVGPYPVDGPLSAQDVVDWLSRRLGPPDSDHGWSASCIDRTDDRWVEWTSSDGHALTLIFLRPRGEEARLSTWVLEHRQGSPPVAWDGVRVDGPLELGLAADHVFATYPNAEFYEGLHGSAWLVRDQQGRQRFDVITGQLTGAPEEAGSRISGLSPLFIWEGFC